MKKLDWKGVGQFIAVCVRLATEIISIFKKKGVGIEIMDWLQNAGITCLLRACDTVANEYTAYEETLERLRVRIATAKIPDLTQTGDTFADWIIAREKIHEYLTGEKISLRDMFCIPGGILIRTNIMPVFRPAGACNRTALDWKVKLGMNASFEEMDVTRYDNSEGPKVPKLYYINKSVEPDRDTLGKNSKFPEDLVKMGKPWLDLYGWSDADNLHFMITRVHLDSQKTQTLFPNDRRHNFGIGVGCWNVFYAQARFSLGHSIACPDVGARQATPLSLKT